MDLKVSVGVGLGGEPLCVECGGRIGPDGLVVGLYAEHPDSRGMLGQFCPGCAGRFTQRVAKGPTAPFDPGGMAVSAQGAREAALRAAKRLRELARDLEGAEYRVG